MTKTLESLGEKRKRMAAQREQATDLITELVALGFAAGTVRRPGAIVLKCAKGLGTEVRGAVMTWDERGFTAEIIGWGQPVIRVGSVSEGMAELKAQEKKYTT